MNRNKICIISFLIGVILLGIIIIFLTANGYTAELPVFKKTIL